MAGVERLEIAGQQVGGGGFTGADPKGSRELSELLGEGVRKSIQALYQGQCASIENPSLLR